MKTGSEEFDVCLLGLGYIGIPTAVIFANCGKKVLGVDISEERVKLVGEGKSHIGEADIDEMLSRVVRAGYLKTSTKPKSSRAYIVAVPTPFKKDHEKKLPDLDFVEAATRSIAPCLQNGQIVILESTSPVGTTEKMREWLLDELKKIGRDTQIDYSRVMFAHAPERILPGQMLKELISNDRIVGGLTPEASEKAKSLYSLFCKGQVFMTDARTAEMTKLTENASRDVAIAFANELSIVCDKFGIDVWELIKLANRHPRVNILSPGPGVGGHCIAVDPWFIISAAEKETPLMRAARDVNDSKPLKVIEKVGQAASECKKTKPCVACLGATFKANVNDMRESPSLKIVEALAKKPNLEVLLVEPHIESLPKSLEGIARKESLESALKEADIVLLLVDHREFSYITKDELKDKIVIDTKGFLSK